MNATATIPQQAQPTHDSFDAALAALLAAHDYREAGRAGDVAALVAPYVERVRSDSCPGRHPMTTTTIERVCLVCGRMAPVVNYGHENGREVGYLGRHWRPGIRRDAKCRGSFGGWVGR